MSDALVVSLTPPSGEGWSASIAWELRTTDGGVRTWTSEPSLSANSSTETVPVREVSLVTGTVGLLVGKVTFRSAGAQRVIGLGGRVVEVTAAGFVPSDVPYTGAMWVGDPQVADDWEHLHDDAEVR